jgi:hypothetical protein
VLEAEVHFQLVIITMDNTLLDSQCHREEMVAGMGLVRLLIVGHRVRLQFPTIKTLGHRLTLLPMGAGQAEAAVTVETVAIVRIYFLIQIRMVPPPTRVVR